MKPEVYFLKYAFPCSHILLKIRKEITEKEHKKLENAAKNNIPLPRKKLEKIFFRAFKRIENIANELKKDKWDIDVIKEYFRIRHNSLLDSSDYPELFRDLCKVHEARVIEIDNNNLTVQYQNRTRKVKKTYTPNVKVNDIVTIHYNYAIEKIK